MLGVDLALADEGKIRASIGVLVVLVLLPVLMLGNTRGDAIILFEKSLGLSKD